MDENGCHRVVHRHRRNPVPSALSVREDIRKTVEDWRDPFQPFRITVFAGHNRGLPRPARQQ